MCPLAPNRGDRGLAIPDVASAAETNPPTCGVAWRPGPVRHLPCARVEATEGPGITLLGSGTLAAQLGEAGLVDEYQFVILPIALGAGRTVFTSGRKLRLVSQRAFVCGNVVATYAPA